MTRVFNDVNFRRDFAARMSANQHDQSFDAFVREIRRSTEAVAVNAGHTSIALPVAVGSPLPNAYVGVGQWAEVWSSTVLGLPGPNVQAIVVTRRATAGLLEVTQFATRSAAGGLQNRTYVRSSTTATTWTAWVAQAFVGDYPPIASYAAPGIVQLVGLPDIVNGTGGAGAPGRQELFEFAGPKFVVPAVQPATTTYNTWIDVPAVSGFERARSVIGYFEFTDLNGGTGNCEAFVRAEAGAQQYQISTHRSGDSSANAHGSQFTAACRRISGIGQGTFQFMVTGGHAYSVVVQGYHF